MLVTFAAPTLAAGEEQPVQADPNREYNIEFKFSDDIVNLKPEELKIINTYNWSSEGLTKAKAGTQLTIYPVDNSNFSWNSYYNYYYDGKKIEDRKFTMPDHDVVIYVTTKSHKAKNYVVSKATSQPTGWVKVTVNAGDHGGFIPQPRSKGDQPYKNETFYVNPLYEVEIIERNQAHFDVVFFDTDSGYKLKDTSKVKGIFTENTNKTLEYDKYLDYKVILHKYGTDETEVLTFAPTATYEEVVKVLRSKETSNPPQGQKFAGWLGEEEHGSRKIYALDKKYDEFNFFNAIYFNNPTYEGKLEDVDLYEVYTPNRIVYTGQKGWRNNLSLDYGEARTVEDGKKVSLYGNDYYEYNLNTKSFSSEKFDKETEIKKDYFLGMDTSGNSEEAKIEIIGEPQYDYKEMAEPKIDLSKMLVGINKYDAEGRGSTTYVHPRDFAAKGITLNYTDGQKLTGEDNGKYIKVTYTENGKEYFVYTNKSLEVIDDGFDKDNIKSIKVNNSPSYLTYEVSDSEEVKFYLDNLEVDLTAANKDNPDEEVVRKVSYKDFKDYGLKVKLVDEKGNEKEVDNDTPVELKYNGMRFVVYWAKPDKDVKADTNIVLKVVDKDAAKKAALKKAKDDAKAEVDKLENLNDDQKEEAKAKIDDATDEAGVNAALKEAQDKDAEIKAKKEAEKALEEKKTELLGKIDEANLKDKKAVEALKKKVNDATVDTDLDKLTEEIESDIKKEQYKENFDQEKEKLKNEIDASDLDSKVKDDLKAKINALTNPEESDKLLEISKEFENAKELKTAKDAAKKEIEKLGDLTDEQKAAAEKAIDEAKNTDEVDRAVKTAQDQDKENKEKKAAEEALKKAKEAAKAELDKLTDLTPEQKEAAEKAIDEAKDTDAVDKAVSAAQAQDKTNKEKKAVDEAKKAAEEAQEAADAEKAKAEEAEKNAADAEKAAEDAQTEADAKAKEAEDAKAAADEAAEKAKEAQDAADKAKEAAEADPNNEELKQAADEAAEKAKEAQAEADAKAKEAEEAEAAANTAKAAATDAKAKADQTKEAAKEAKDAADKAQEEADKAKADAEAKENALAPTAEEKDKAKKAIDDLDNLSPAEKNKFKDDVDKAQTKGKVEKALADAKAKDEENKNNPQPEPQPGEDPYEPYDPGHRYEPSPDYLRDYTRRDEKPVEKKEEKKEEVKTEEKKDIFKTLYFYLDKYFYEMELNGNISQIPMDVAPTAINQRTMLPIRFVAEAIGATVEWHQDTQSATFTKDGITAIITLGSNIIQVSDGRQIVLDAEPAVVDQRIFVPLTNISQIFGLTNGDLRDGNDNDIEWDQENYRVIITVRENQ